MSEFKSSHRNCSITDKLNASKRSRVGAVKNRSARDEL